MRSNPKTALGGAAALFATLLACGGEPGRQREPDASGGAGGAQDAGAGGSGGGAGPAGSCVPTTLGAKGNEWKNPVIRCRWARPGHSATHTPLVIDLDGDKRPEIVFVSIEAGESRRHLRAIRGTDCSEVWAVEAEIGLGNELAAGDLDGDGRPEIVAVDYPRDPKAGVAVRVHGWDGALLAKGMDLGRVNDVRAVALAELDGEPPAEIIAGDAVLRFRPGSPGTIEKVWQANVPRPLWGWLSLAADLDLDGAPEVVTGNRILDGATGTDETPAALGAHVAGYASLAQIDKATPEPELVLVSSIYERAEINVLRTTDGSTLFGPYALPLGKSGFAGGGPVVADFDGDGEVEYGTSSPTHYLVYDPACAATPLPAECVEPGVRWKAPIQDFTSGGTSSTVFDFNCDGRAEVVYRDECWLRIFDGNRGKVLAAYPVMSGTLLEEPVVADADGDGRAEIVVSSDAHLMCPGKPEAATGAAWTPEASAILVLGDPDNRWSPVRPIWNQNTYHVTNVEPDGRIPAVETPAWTRHNSYRQNTP